MAARPHADDGGRRRGPRPAGPPRGAAHPGDRAAATASAPAPTPFPLLRWFAVTSAAAILAVLVVGTAFLNRAVERTSLAYDAEVMTQLVASIVETEHGEGFFRGGGGAAPDAAGGEFAGFLARLGKLPNVLRANVYGRDGTVLWSSEPALRGRRFLRNEELNAALAGRPAAATGTVGAGDGKEEHANFGGPGDRFVENYLPVRGGPDGGVLGVVEVYRAPARLLREIGRAQGRLRWAALGVGLGLYGALFLLAARAAVVMGAQQRALVAAGRLSVAGEMASAMAHGLRNPLASIRSSAELALAGEANGETRGLLAQVVADADRLEGWIRRFLATSRVGSDTGPTTADPAAVVRACAAQFGPALARRGAALEVDLAPALPRVRPDAMLLGQVLGSVLANAAEALPDGGGGRVTVRGRKAGRGRVLLEVEDTGAGMGAEEMRAAFEPFVTGKPEGLGLGLPLAREALERHGGGLSLASAPGRGTVVRLALRAA